MRDLTATILAGLGAGAVVGCGPVSSTSQPTADTTSAGPRLDHLGLGLEREPTRAVQASTDAAPGEPEPPEEPVEPVEPAPSRPTLRSLGEMSLAPGHVTVFELTGGPPETALKVWARPFGGGGTLGDPVEVATIVVDAAGRGSLRLFYQPILPAPGESTVTRLLLAAGTSPTDLGPTLDLPVATPQLTQGPADEVWPGLGPLSVGDGPIAMRTCVPAELMPSCPSVPGATRWQAADMLSWAFGRPLVPELEVTPVAMELGFPGACCMVVNLPFPEPVADTGDTGTWTVPPSWDCLLSGWGCGFAGRPLIADGALRLAPVRAGLSDWSRAGVGGTAPVGLTASLAAGWAQRAQAEHASVGSFARFVLDLLAFGAPARLVARATQSQADEVRHAEQAFALASHWAGDVLGPGPLDLSGLRASASLAEAVFAAVREGCVEETVAAAQVRASADAAHDPELRALLHAVADDEAEHAALAWAFVKWALDQQPELAGPVAALFAAWSPRPEPEPEMLDLAPWGLLSPQAEHRIARSTFQDVVRPCMDALIGRAHA